MVEKDGEGKKNEGERNNYLIINEIWIRSEREGGRNERSGKLLGGYGSENG